MGATDEETPVKVPDDPLIPVPELYPRNTLVEGFIVPVSSALWIIDEVAALKAPGVALVTNKEFPPFWK